MIRQLCRGVEWRWSPIGLLLRLHGMRPLFTWGKLADAAFHGGIGRLITPRVITDQSVEQHLRLPPSPSPLPPLFGLALSKCRDAGANDKR